MTTRQATATVNRAPVLTLWAAVVAERLGFDRDEALERAAPGLNESPQSRARLGAYSGIGSRELLRRFSVAYYTILRLALARRLLEHTEHPVSEITVTCGFGSASAVARAFRERHHP